MRGRTSGMREAATLKSGPKLCAVPLSAIKNAENLSGSHVGELPTNGPLDEPRSPALNFSTNL